MPEQYANSCKTTLTSAYTAGDGVINVTSTAAPFPQAVPFSLVVKNTTETLNKVLLRVTAINSSTQWAVTAEGTDANASNGDHVVGTQWTKLAIDGMRADLVTYGAYASLPSAADKKKGDQYLCTDSKYDFIHNGSIWVPRFGGQFVTAPPASGGLSWVNQGSTTIDETKGGILMHGVSQGSHALSGLVKAIPGAGSYTFDIGFTLLSSAENYAHYGLLITDTLAGGNNKLILFGVFFQNVPTLLLYKYTSATNATSSYVQWNPIYSSERIYLRVNDNRTNFTFYWSIDGVFWDQVYQVSRTDWLGTPTNMGIGVDPLNNRISSTWFFHWTGV